MQDKCHHVFLVGMARSGTTMMSDVLNRSQEIGISMFESHFLHGTHGFGRSPSPSFREQLKTIGDLATDDGMRKIVAFIYDHPKPFWRQIVSQVAQPEFLDLVSKSDRTERSLFDIGMKLNAGGKPISGEKTPGHVYHVPTLLEWFPDAKVIHMVRDPRATFVSQKKKRERKNKMLPAGVLEHAQLLRELYISTSFIHGWKQVVQLHLQYQTACPDQYYLLRYEDIVSNPESTLRQLCDFIGIQFTDALTTGQVNINSSFVEMRQAPGFDKQAIDRWKTHMHPLIRRWFDLWCNQSMRNYSYTV